MYADDAIAWVAALTDPCHAALAAITQTNWTRFSLLVTDGKLEDLLRAGAVQGPRTPGRGPYQVTKALPLGTLLTEIQKHVVEPLRVEPGLSADPWWVGRGARLRSLGAHFRARYAPALSSRDP